MNEIIPQNNDTIYSAEMTNGWSCDSEIVNAVWNLVQLIGSDDANNISGLLADFISKVCFQVSFLECAEYIGFLTCFSFFYL